MSTTGAIRERKFTITAFWIALGITGCLGLGFVFFGSTTRAPQRVIRIGYLYSPPYHFPDPNGRPSGPAVDIVSEAARRAHIRLQWVHAPDGPEIALRAGTVDLW